ncbi:MAG: hypothetical protein RR359_05475 [Bacilli bacterium]
MNNNIKELLLKSNIKPSKYNLKGHNIEVFDNDKRYIVKSNYNNKEVFNYLNLRGFNYYLDYINSDRNIEIYPYLDKIVISDEQKISDIIYLISILHNKTSYYIDLDLDKIKKIYEDNMLKVEYLNKYYHSLQDIIENTVYMSPSNYLLIRNITNIYSCLEYVKGELDKWYLIVKDNKKERVARIHNNLELDHIIHTKDQVYLNNWNKSIIDDPVYDLVNLYNKYYYVLDFSSLFDSYETVYKLKKEEKLLLFILISIPNKIEFTDNEITNTKHVYNLLEKLKQSNKIISKYYTNTVKEETHN